MTYFLYRYRNIPTKRHSSSKNYIILLEEERRNAFIEKLTKNLRNEKRGGQGGKLQ